MDSDLADLKKEVALLRKEISRVSDEAEVRKVHFKYGYYLDKCLYNEASLSVVDMYADHPDTYVEFLGSRYRGKEGVRRLYNGRFQQAFVQGRNGPVHGFLLDHIMMQDIVDVDPSGTHAWCRMRALMSAGTHMSVRDSHPRGHVQWWEGGLYENEYLKEDGVWKLFRYRYFPFWHAEFEKGWSLTKGDGPTNQTYLPTTPLLKPTSQPTPTENYIPWPTRTFPEDPLGPDEIIEQKMLWPDTRVVPFHYPHPVTGRRARDDDLRAPPYGQDPDPAAAPPPLTLALPAGQARKGAGKTWVNGGSTRVLPDLVENAE
ncbi:SnoaL-like domain-containing protein [Xylariomycetidae sp. FL2044]|nr:SnoaL-like domain-containing protein [Xylariomycetidae sp. FL2044]